MKFFSLLCVGALAGVVYVAYDYHNNFYQKVRTHESNRHGQSVAKAVTEHYKQHGNFPDDTSEQLQPDSGEWHVGQVSFHDQTGVLTILIDGEDDSEGVLTYVPTFNEGEITYECKANLVPENLVPANCTPSA